MTLECELAELRRVRNSEWEKTKHHLKLAKSKTSLNLQESFERPEELGGASRIGQLSVSPGPGSLATSNDLQEQPGAKQGSLV